MRSVGVMITASHNPPEDNGIKIVDSDGGMLSPKWEPLAEDVANIEKSLLYQCLQDIANSHGIKDLTSLQG